MTQKSFCCILHLLQNHGRDLFRMKCFPLTLVLYLYQRLITSTPYHLEREVPEISLDARISKTPANQPLSIIDCVGRIACRLILSRITEKSFRICKSNIGGSGPPAF
mmetsp:Transcript_11128/g.27844  ORF Transcript_11128/g.27844 Transcript_11128/m.27844 type:complete len:107 (-) Transcript_11128:404-724(-)